jgi:ribosomal protein S12 methylthiotransferase accessory factor YcaO
MILHDSYKHFVDRGMAKLVPPEETVRTVLRQIGSMQYPILEYYEPVHRPSGIPQYVFAVNENFRRYKAKVANTNGKGHIPAQAMASGLMELAERYSCHKYIAFRNGNIASVAQFSSLTENAFTLESFLSVLWETPDERLKEFLNNAYLALYLGSTLDGQDVLIPVNLLNYFVTTNGMASGNSLEEAILHALCEVIERHCLLHIRNKKLQTPLIDPVSINNPVARNLIRQLTGSGQHLTIRDFSLGIGIPVIGVIRSIDTGNCLVTAGVATHRDEALVRALTENSQGENKKFFEGISASEQYFTADETADFEGIPCIDDMNYKTELETLRTLLIRQNMTVMYVDMTDEELAVPSVFAVITNTQSDTVTPMPAPSHFACSLIEESLFLERFDDTAGYIALGRAYEPDNKLYIYYEGLLLTLMKKYEEALACFNGFRDCMDQIDNFYKQRILAFTALCQSISGNGDNSASVHNQLIEWDTNQVFNWQEGYSQIMASEMKRIRLAMVAPYHERVLHTCRSETVTDVRNAIGMLLKFNLNAGLLFNHYFLAGLVYMSIGEYDRALSHIMKARKSQPQEALYDEMIRQCRERSGQNRNMFQE